MALSNAQRRRQTGWWCPGTKAPDASVEAILGALHRLDQPFSLVESEGRLAVAEGGTWGLGRGQGAAYPLMAQVPTLDPADLGAASFREDYGLRYAYVVGAMANGISSVDLVAAAAEGGLLGIFGAAGLSVAEVSDAITALKERVQNGSFGVNLIHSPQEPELEDALVDLLIKEEIGIISASAFMGLTPALVRYRLAGLSRDAQGKTVVGHRILAKVSREEVATQFLRPAPDRLVRKLLEAGQISREQADLAATVPMADDLTAEADSGGHTDHRALVVLLPTLLALRDRIQGEEGYAQPPRIGAAGGIATPASASAALSLGADYLLTGSVNQACLESGSSDRVRQLLAQAKSTDVTRAPAADMFEMGVTVQVLSKGTLFAQRAKKLDELYRRYAGLEDLSKAERKKVTEILGQSIDEAWASCEAFFAKRDPAQLEKAARDPKHRMALVFRSYLGLSSRWANAGDETRALDYQIWCGPSMGAFNDWVAGTWLEDWSARTVLPVAHNILIGAAALCRVAALRAQGLALPPMVFRPLDGPEAVRLLERCEASTGSLEPTREPVEEAGETGASREPIAIVGMGALFPKAEDLTGYWRTLRHGTDAIDEVPVSHWSLNDYYDEDPKAPDMTYGRRGGFLDPVNFDPTEFGIPPTILEATDTSQLLALLVARQALDDAGYSEGLDWDRSRTSVILGVTGTQELVINLGARLGHPRWRKALAEAGVDPETTEDVVSRIAESYVGWQESSFPGLLGNVVAGRIANRLNLGGTNCVVDAACASSFGALHMALMELETGRSDMVLSGGVDALNDIFMHMCFSKTPALSASGDCRPFSANGDGTLLGEGVGMVVLKRLSDAERDGDRVYAVLRSVGTSSDGRAKSIYAPVASGQARALKSAYDQAGVSPASVGMVEAHGTGTKAGDLAEFTALNEVYREAQPEGQWCALGSVKSQIGHTKAAAGAAGLIKAALALRHKVLLPTLKATDQPNEKLGLGDSPFFLSDRARPWLPRAGHPRRAAVSSFGFGGSDFHALLEEYRPQRATVAWDGSLQLLALSAPRLEDLRQALQGLRALPLDEAMAGASFSAADPHRVVLVANSAEDLGLRVDEVLAALEQAPDNWSSPSGSYYGQGAAEPMAFVFPGQGAQRVDMLLELACLFPEFMESLSALGPLAHQIYPAPARHPEDEKVQQEALTRTDVAQPALGAIGRACFELMGRFGLEAQHFAGHSYGELVALHAAGALSAQDLMAASRARGKAMAGDGGDRGTMLVVLAPLQSIRDLIEEQGLQVVLANENGPAQGVLSGTHEAIDAAEAACKAAKLRSRRIPVAAAFHSPLVAEAEEAFTGVLRGLGLQLPHRPVYANSTAAPYAGSPDDCVALLGGQLARPVRWRESVECMWQAGARVFVELGPQKTLGSMIARTLGDRAHHCIALDDGGSRGALFGLAKLLARLAALGQPVRLAAWQQQSPGPRAEFITERQAKMSVPISGVNYRSPYEQRPPRDPVTPSVVAAQPSPAPAPVTPRADTAVLQQSLQQLQALQAQTARLHEIFLEGQRQAQQGIQTLLTGAPLQAPVIAAAPLAVAPAPVAVQSAPQPAQARPAPAALPAAVSQSSPLPQPEVGPGDSVVSTESLAESLRAVTAETTGYPATMLDLDMEFESDLGVDSIKRVEILSRLADRIPGAPQVNPEDLSDLRSLQQVIDFMAEKIAASGGVAAPSSSELGTHAPAASHLDSAQVSAAVFKVIAQTTGYPESMLEESMEFEADLGVDSIKRVEILSRVAEALPGLPQVNPEDLADLRSIAQVVGFLMADLETAESEDSQELVSQGPAAEPEVEPMPEGTLHCRALRPRLYQAPLPDDLPAFHLPPDHELWIHNDGSELAPALVHAFEARGVSARLIDDEGQGNCKPCAGLLLLGGAGTNSEDLWSEASEEQLKRGILLLTRLAPALKSALEDGAALLCSLSRLDGRMGLSSACSVVDPLHGGLAGLVKTAVKEWPGLNGRALDLDPAWSPELAAEAAVDACLAGGPLELGLGPNGPMVADLMTSPQPRSRKAFDAGSLFVITGGARGVTAACAAALAGRQPGLRLALFGRSSLDEEPVWLNGVEGEAQIKALLMEHSEAALSPKALTAACHRVLAQREIRASLKAIESVGAKASYCAVDLRDRDAVSRELSSLVDRFGPVRGIIHGAGVLRDRHIKDKTRDQVDDVLDTKLAGLRHVLEAVDLDEVRSLSLFASITGRVGRVGQVDYAVANQALDKIAWSLANRLPNCRVQSFAWGPWDGGMVTPGLRQAFLREGVGLIPLEAGAERCAQWALAAPGGAAELLVGVDLPELTETKAADGDDYRPLRLLPLHPDLPVLANHQLAGEGVVPMALGIDWMVDEALHLGLGLQLSRVEEARVLQGVSVAEPLLLTVCLDESRSEGEELRQLMSVRDEEGRRRFSAEVVLSNEAPVVQAKTVAAIVGDGGYADSEIYKEALFHGPLLQAIESVDGLGPEGIDVSLVRPQADGPWLGSDGNEPDSQGTLWLDSAFQAMILWSRDQQSAPSLPSSFGRWQRFRAWPATAPRLRARVRSVKGALITSDICFLGPEDEVVALVEGYSATASPQLAKAFMASDKVSAPKP